ncbi:MAG: HNH endonuclease signature motif containing protein, partial [Candidatus Thorarchaeota archaeon]
MKRCVECTKSFKEKDYRQKFCCRSCSARFNNRGKRKHGNAPRDCLRCGKKNKEHKAKYCSTSCSRVHKSELKVKAWQEGTDSGSYADGTLSSVIRRHLLWSAGHKCPQCGWAKVSDYVAHGKPVLTIDHIDGNWTNNKVENLRVLCYNCHTLTPTFGSLSS